MLILGHAGIALGAAVALSEVMPDGEAAARGNGGPGGLIGSWFARLGRHADIRLVLVGSLLPDILDKPVGELVFRETLGSGRIFAHSLAFLLLLTLGGLYQRRRTGSGSLLALAFGVLAHQACDRMWLEPVTLLWPLLGPFPRAAVADWFDQIWHALLHDPAVYVPEILGGTVLIALAWVLVRGAAVRRFVMTGRLDRVRGAVP